MKGVKGERARDGSSSSSGGRRESGGLFSAVVPVMSAGESETKMPAGGTQTNRISRRTNGPTVNSAD